MTCRLCRGSGVVYEPDPDAGPIPQPCPNCHCPRCDQRWANHRKDTPCTTSIPKSTTKGH